MHTKAFYILAVFALLVITVFAVLALTDKLSGDVVMGVVTMVVAFYFGTQSEKSK